MGHQGGERGAGGAKGAARRELLPFAPGTAPEGRAGLGGGVVQEAYVHGVSTRKVDELVRALGMGGISKSQVSRLCEELDEEVERFRDRPLEGAYPYVWLDATYVKARQDGRWSRWRW